MWIRFRASFIRFRSDKSEHTPADRLVWRRNVSSAFLMIVLLDQASGASKVTDHVRYVWLEKLYMDQLHNTTAVSPDRVDRCNLLGYRIITAAVLHFTSFFFPIPFIVMLALLSPSQCSSITQIRGHIAGSPPPSPLRHLPSFLSREEFSIFFPRRFASICTYPRC